MNKLNKKLFLLILTGILFFSSVSIAQEITSHKKMLKLYYLDWRSLTKGRLVPDDIRRLKPFYMEVSDFRAISAFEKRLTNLKCPNPDGLEMGDIRLVVDFLEDDKVYRTLYAYRTTVYIDGKRCKVSEDFFNIFTYALDMSNN